MFLKTLRIFFWGLCLLWVTDLVAQRNNIPVVGFNDLEKLLQSKSDTTYIINFWATWCAPCRKELPDFEKIHKTYSDKKIKVLLVSLDQPQNLETSLKTFLSLNNITASVILLNDPDANSWIDKVDPSWTGALPATLVYKGNSRLFYEKQLSYQDIENSINSINNL